MKKQGKAKAAAAKPDAADGKAAKVAADNGKKSGKSKTRDNGEIALDTLFKGLGVGDEEQVELLREIAKGIKTIADRVESVRRTLWRMSEIREYENKGAKGKPEKGGKPKANRKPETAEGGEK